MSERFEMCLFVQSLRASLTRWLTKSPLAAVKNLSQVDTNSLPGSVVKDQDSRSVHFGNKSNSSSVFRSPVIMEDLFGCDESGQSMSIKHCNQHPLAKKYRARCQPLQFSNQSIHYPSRARCSVDSKLTAVDSASFVSQSPSSASSPGSQVKLNRTLPYGLASPVACTSPLTFSSYSQFCPVIYSQPPSQPAPTCPLPCLPVDRPSVESPSSFQSNFSTSSSPASSPLSGSTSSSRFVLSPSSQCFSSRLKPLTTLPKLYRDASDFQQVGQLEHDFYEKDPFAAEKLVVSRPLDWSQPVWADEESVDPLGPMSFPRRLNSIYAASSGSCYSVNTSIERLAIASLDVASSPNVSNSHVPLNSISLNEDSQEGLKNSSVTREGEYLKNLGMTSSHHSPLPRSEGKCLSVFSSRPQALDTFSFGLPSRFDGFFFGNHRCSDTKQHPGPPIVLEVSPPTSCNRFSPGDSIRVKIYLASAFDNLIVSFVGESRLLGERKLKSHQFLKHEIDLDRPRKWGHWMTQRGASLKEWVVDFKVPSISNCDCGKRLCGQNSGGLELPSSTINDRTFISYHLIVRGIGKQQEKQKASRKHKKAKGEDKVRLTVMINHKFSPNYQTVRKRIQAGHRCSCFSIER